MGIIALIIVLYIMINPGSNYDRIQIVGSTSVQPVAEELTNKFVETHSNIKTNVQGGGSSLAISSVNQGIADIGMSSMEINDSFNFTKIIIGYDGIVVCINNENMVTDLSSQEIKDIFSGKITNWKELGGEDKPINVITREEGSGTRSEFQKIIMKGSDIKKDAIIQSSTESIKQSVASDSNAIGFISYAHMNDEVKALKVDGIFPSEITIADGTYKIKIPFLFIYKGEKTGVVQEFLEFLKTPDAIEIIKNEKIIPVN